MTFSFRALLEASAAWARRLWSCMPVLLGFSVSGFLLVLAMRKIRFPEVARALSEVRGGWLSLMLAIMLADLVIRAVRWRMLLSSAAPRATLRQVFELETIGLAVNNVLFFRLGEVVRALLAAQTLQVPALTSFATILIERLLDTMSLLVIFGMAARSYPALVEPRLGFLAFAGAGAVVLLLLGLAMADGSIQKSEWRVLGKRFPRTYHFLQQAVLGTRALRSWTAAPAIVLLGLTLWLVDAGLFWVTGRAMGLVPQLTFGHSVMVLASGAASSFIPAVPGSFGTFEQALMLILVHLGVGESVAFGFAGFVHVLSYIVITGLGIVFLYRAGHTLASLKRLGQSRKGNIPS